MRLADDGLELPDDPMVRADLLSVRKRVTMNGLAIELPRTADGRHADYAPALALVASKTREEAHGEDTRPEYLSDEWYAAVEKIDLELYGAVDQNRGSDWLRDTFVALGCEAPPLDPEFDLERIRLIRAITRGGPRATR